MSNEIRVGYSDEPFVREVLRVSRLKNRDEHPTAPIIELQAAASDGGTFYALLTRADVQRLLGFLTTEEKQSGDHA